MYYIQVFLLFIAYSFIGWLCEVIYCSILEKRFVNRGFLRGPLCPIYGCGGLLVIFFLKPYSHTWVQLFLAGAFITSLLEYLTSYLMEKLFHAKWWDYSDLKFNINGRICLLNTVLFGLMSVFAVHFVHTPIFNFIQNMPSLLTIILGSVLGAFFLVDCVLTVKSLISFNMHLAKFNEFTDSLKERFENEEWFSSHSISAMLNSVKTRASIEKSKIEENILDKIETFNVKKNEFKHLLSAFPSVKIKKYELHLQQLKIQFKVELKFKQAEIIQAHKEKKGLPVKPVSKEEILAQVLKQIEEQKIRDEINSQTSFARGFNYYKLFWIFLICCVLGTIIETLYVLICTGVYQSRTGLIYGPFNPIYGFGAVLMTILLSKAKDKRDFAIFIGGMIIGGAFEYLCSFLQENVLGSVSWDYSEMPFNLFGRINLLYCFFWGILGLLWVKDLYPEMSKSIERIPSKIGVVLSWILTAFMIFNMIFSFFAVARMGSRMKGVLPQNEIDLYLDKYFPDDVLKEIYPSMEFQ